LNESSRTIYCATCEEEREFHRETHEEEYDVRSEKIVLTVPVLICPICGSTVVGEEYGDPIDHVFAEYRRRRGLLTPEGIRGIRKRYFLSQRALAVLLGMSEATVNRYEGGGLQDEAHDNMLRACGASQYMHDLLKRRGHLLTDRQRQRLESVLQTADEQSPEAWGLLHLLESSPLVGARNDEFSGFREFEYERYAAVFCWFLRNLKAVFSSKIRTYGRSITGALYAKLPYGPVPNHFRSLEDQLESDGVFVTEEISFPNGKSGYEYRPGPGTERARFDFTRDEQRVLEFVLATFAHQGAVLVSERSHQEAAWKETEDNNLISYHKALELSVSLPENGDTTGATH